MHADWNPAPPRDSPPPQIEEAQAPAPADNTELSQKSPEEISTESFIDGLNTDGVLEKNEDEESQQAQDAIDLETKLKDAQASPVGTLVDRILLQAIGEETGEMDKMLSKVADFYEDEVGAMVKALTSMLEPAMIVVGGGIVG